jgi:hypothetical protein
MGEAGRRGAMRARRRGLAIAFAGLCLGVACGEDQPAAPAAPAPAPTATPAPAPSATPAPSAPTAPVSLSVKLNPNPPSGPAPLELHVSLCGSRPVPPVDDYPLTFTLDWGEGRRHTRYFCRDDHVYEVPGVYRATFCAADGIAGHESCASFRVKVE